MNAYKLGALVGSAGRCNEVVCSQAPGKNSNQHSLTLFFGGDVQDYPEVMSSHRDHGKYLQWNLLNVVNILSLKFPESIVCAIKPKRMEFKTFSCYDNFVESNNLGVPTFTDLYGALSHLKNLITSISQYLSGNICIENDSLKDEVKNSTTKNNEVTFECVNLIGFSKGCAVLNQIITEAHTLSTDNSLDTEELLIFWKKVRSIYLLDGGHAGGKNTWITNRKILQTLASFSDLDIHVHVTPYQVCDNHRPWIGKECKSFVETLKRQKARVHYQLHFEDLTACMENHFNVIQEAFK